MINEIEKKYVEWAIQKPIGIFLITWPWPDVRFLPVLLTEYCISSPDEKIVVIGDYDGLSEVKKIISTPTLFEILNKTVFIDNPAPASEGLKKEMIILKKNHSLLFEQKKVVSVKYRKFGSGKIETYICPHSLKKCSNEVKKDASDENFGKSYLRTITHKKINGMESQGYNSQDVSNMIVDPNHGLWDVTLTEQDLWSGKLNYNILWLAEILQNYKKITSCQDILSSVCYYDETQVVDTTAKVHLISSKIGSDKIFSLIQKISPNLLIIENTDDMISDIRYCGPASKSLLEYLTHPSRTVFLFSTNPEKRQFYKLESEKNIFFPISVVVQTLDSSQVLTQLSPNTAQSKFHNPISSMTSDLLEERNNKIICQYIKLDALTSFSQTIMSLFDSIEKEFSRDIRFYLRRVISSPLHIIGDYSDPKFLSAKRGFTGLSITYHSIHNDLAEYADDGRISKDIPDLFHKTFYDQYLPETNQNKNPLRDEFIRKARELCERNLYNNVIFVVNFRDIKGLEKIIAEDETLPQDLKTRIFVSGWNNLHETETMVDINTSLFVISSQYPSLKYNLRNSQIKEFIFFSDNDGIEGIKEIIDLRLLERFSFPVVSSKENWDGPSFLRESLGKLDLPPPTRINELYQDEDDEIVHFSDWKHNDTESHEPSEYQPLSIIETGNEVVLCINRAEQAIFIPFGKTVMVQKGELPEDIHIDFKNSDAEIEKKLINTGIILGKSGLFLSFRGFFFKFMMQYGKRMKFQKRPYAWDGYESLFNDSIHWIRLIEKAIQECAIKDLKNQKNADAIISLKLIESDITAKELGTVIGWFTNYDEISLNSGQYRLYRTEHPFRLEDLRKIFIALQEFLTPSDLNKVDPEKVYAASLCLQEFRRKIFQSSPEENPMFVTIRSGLKKEINNILIEAETFSPLIAKRVKITKTVHPMKIISDYRNYL
ncbi:MAG: hypothetical protein PHF57_01185 [Methanoregula sp.]|nr:hypothetical protein [Methanoregula sp.]